MSCARRKDQKKYSSHSGNGKMTDRGGVGGSKSCVAEEALSNGVADSCICPLVVLLIFHSNTTPNF